MPRSHIHGSPRRFYYGLNLTDDPGNAIFRRPIRMHQISMIKYYYVWLGMQYGKLRTNMDCHEYTSMANPASSPWMCDLGIRQEYDWAVAWDFQQCGMCDQLSLRSACAYAQSDQSLCLSLEYSMSVKLLTEYHFELLILIRGCAGSSESIRVKMPHCWKSRVTVQLLPSLQLDFNLGGSNVNQHLSGHY